MLLWYEEPRKKAHPVAQPKDSYVPANRPAIGDLMSLFDFGKRAARRR
jgi:hypothetical protein